jgi:hypothetical protein
VRWMEVEERGKAGRLSFETGRDVERVRAQWRSTPRNGVILTLKCRSGAPQSGPSRAAAAIYVECQDPRLVLIKTSTRSGVYVEKRYIPQGELYGHE